MTDAGGQIALPAARELPSRGRLAAGTAGVAACALLASVGLGALTPGTADAKTTVEAPGPVSAELPDGSQLLLADGDEVPRGATVRTAGRGAATLVTRGREVLLGSGTEVTVVDGARQVLLRGLVLVNATDAPGLDVDAGAGTVTVRDDGLVRVERGPASLRVAVLEGASRVGVAGRSARTDVDELFQVQVPYGGLAGPPTPLVLTHDAWEKRFALDLVQDDLGLRALARGLDAGEEESAAVLSVTPAAIRSDVESAPPASSPRSERLLGFLLAASASRGGESLEERYATVRGYRQLGGSWGVVGALVAAGADSVAAALDAVLSPDGVALPGDPAAPGAPGSDGTTAPRPGESPRPPGARPPGGSGRPPSPRPTSSPSSSADPVDDVVTTVISALPTSLRQATGAAVPPLVVLHLGGG